MKGEGAQLLICSGGPARGEHGDHVVVGRARDSILPGGHLGWIPSYEALELAIVVYR